MNSVLASNAVGKVTAEHLARTAFLYVRQSTLRQVIHNTESTQRQYALRQRAIAARLAGRADRCDRHRPGAVRRFGGGS